MSNILEDRAVITKKPHFCWGCKRLFPAGTNMHYKTEVDSGFLHSYWCGDCIKFMSSLEPYDRLDGFEYGGLLNYDEYRMRIEGYNSSFRECYCPHLRDYPVCFEECGLDVCEAPLFSEHIEKSVRCGNCGKYRMIEDNHMVEKCPNCGDDEYELGGITNG